MDNIWGLQHIDIKILGLYSFEQKDFLLLYKMVLSSHYLWWVLLAFIQKTAGTYTMIMYKLYTTFLNRL